MEITAVEAIPYCIPVAKPARFASGSITRAENVLVRVHTSEGLVGQAEAQPRPYTYAETQLSILTAIRNHLAPALEKVDPLATELVYERCSRLHGNNVARGAVDLAIWDIVGKALGQPCSVLLGGYARQIRVAHMLSLRDPAAMAADAVGIFELYGVRAFKIKVGRDVAVDIAACGAIRNALPDADLYVDANRGWTYEQAAVAGDALADLGILGIEEPISIDDRDGRRRLAHRWQIPIVGDESCISLAHTARTLDEGAVRAVSIKTARTGFTESRRILDLCLGRSRRVIVGSQYEGGAGVLATSAFAAAFAATAGLPAEIMNFTDLADDVLATSIDVRDGWFTVPDAPGLGIEIDEDKLSSYRVDARATLAPT